MQTVETARLVLRGFDENDVDVLYAMMANADAMRYTYTATSREDCVKRLRAYAALGSTLGYAPWTVTLRAEKRVIGWGGLNVDPFAPGWGTEVAYFLHPAYWGRGYATELVRAALALGFDTLHMESIVAFAHRENVGSIRVLEKCGFRLLGYVPQLDRNQYIVERSTSR